MKKFILLSSVLILGFMGACKKDKPVQKLEDKIAGKWNLDKYELYYEPADPANSDMVTFTSSEFTEFKLPSGADLTLIYNINPAQADQLSKWTKIDENSFHASFTFMPPDNDVIKVVESSSTKLVLQNEFNESPTKKRIIKLTLSKPYAP